MARGQRKLSGLLGLSAGEKLERDVFAGIDARSILDAGLTWALVQTTAWTLDGVTALAWSHESRSDTSALNDTVGLFQVLSRIPFGDSSDITQRFTYYPDFNATSAYRSELELTAEAAMNAHLALKIGYLLRVLEHAGTGIQEDRQQHDGVSRAALEGRDRSAGTIESASFGQIAIANPATRSDRSSVFSNDSASRHRASSSHFDDAMIRLPRMTIASLEKRMDGRFTHLDRRTNRRFDAIDARFDAVDARLDATDGRMRVGFESIHAKLDSLFRDLDDKYRHVDNVLNNYENRLKDLEADHSTSP